MSPGGRVDLWGDTQGDRRRGANTHAAMIATGGGSGWM